MTNPNMRRYEGFGSIVCSERKRILIFGAFFEKTSRQNSLLTSMKPSERVAANEKAQPRRD